MGQGCLQRQLGIRGHLQRFGAHTNDVHPLDFRDGILYLGSTKLRGTEGDRWTFTASGPITVLAARLSEYGQGGLILTGEETARRVGQSFSLRSLGKLALKNLEDSGEVFQVTE